MTNKLIKFPFILIILLNAIQFCFGQKLAKSELCDDFGKITQEDFDARFDNFLNRLNQTSSSSTGYVIIHNKKDLTNERDRFYYEQWAKGQIRSKKVSENRLLIIKAEDQNELLIQFWLVPRGAEKPPYTEIKWNTTLSSNTRSFIFTTTDSSERGLGVPAEYLNLNLFSEYLENNPAAHGNFVIKERSKNSFLQERSKITSLLAGKYKITSQRLRFFYVRENKPISDYYPDVEVWLVFKQTNPVLHKNSFAGQIK